MLASFPASSEIMEMTELKSWYDSLLPISYPSPFLSSSDFADLHDLRLIYLIRWLGEKYDGVRCCWNPEEEQLYLIMFLISLLIIRTLFDFTRYSRNNVRIDIHSLVKKMFGRVVLDGEIWYLFLSLSRPPSFIFFLLLSLLSLLLIILTRFGRGHYGESHVLVQTSLHKVDWGLFRYAN